MEEPTLETLLNYFRDQGVVGEEENCLIQSLATIVRIPYGVEGPSGSGKSFIVDPLVELMNEEVYSMELSSNTAEMYNADKINQNGIIYIPELQKAMTANGIVVEVIKNLTEGKDAVRRVRDQSKRENLTYRITSGKQVIYTLATENQYKKDAELTRRFLQLQTDTSPEHVDQVLKAKADRRALPPSKRKLVSEGEVSALQRHMLECFRDKEATFVNPFAPYLTEHIAREVSALSIDDHYFMLMEASAKYHNNQRNKLPDGTIIVNIQDAYLASQLASTLWNEIETSEVDWEQCFYNGYTQMYQQFPEQADRWMRSQVNGNEITLKGINTRETMPAS